MSPPLYLIKRNFFSKLYDPEQSVGNEYAEEAAWLKFGLVL